MGLTTGARVTAGTAGIAAVGGFSLILNGTFTHHLSRTVHGTCVTLTAVTAIALVLIRHWIVDTSEERRLLAASQREAQAERSRYFAAEAALVAERARLEKDRLTQQRADAERLKAERKAMAEEFQEQRAALIAETIESFTLMIASGAMTPPTPPESKVIQFPHQHQHSQPQAEPQRRPQRARSREHGASSP